MAHKLPKGWVKTTLGELNAPSRVRTQPSEEPDLPYVGMEHVEAQTMKLLGHRVAGAVKSSAVRFNTGDVLYGKMRPYLNKVWLAAFDGLCSAEFLVFPRTDGLSNQLLAYRLNAEDFVNFANQHVSGDRPRVGFSELARFSCLLAPSREQERIVTKLNALLTRVTAGEIAARRALDRLQRYRYAVLDAAVSGELTRGWRNKRQPDKTGAELLNRLLKTRRARWEGAQLQRLTAAGKAPKGAKWKNRYLEPIAPDKTALPSLPKGWTWASVDQLAAHETHSITDGPFGSHLKSSHYTTSGPRVVRLQNIGDGVFINEIAHISREHYEFLKDHAIYPGDLVIRALGTPAPRACRIPEIGPAIVKADCIRFKVAADFVDSSFVLCGLNSPATQQRTEKMIHGIGRPRLNLAEIKGIALPLPPQTEQKEIAKNVERRLAAANRVTAAVLRQLNGAHGTRQKLLRKAFVGDLVSQDPQDEPASLLLRRIRAARDARGKQLKTKRMPKSQSKSKPVETLEQLEQVVAKLGGAATPERLLLAAGLADDVEKFFDLLRAARDSGRWVVPVGNSTAIRRI